ncbi:hypothetical protein [Nostoc sp. CCY0012]|uniref:hypothetical protein n=1 Tax=Nostoc sp. CCY0012 TaxID=1056123 RepID=UPI0039C62E31
MLKKIYLLTNQIKSKTIYLVSLLSSAIIMANTTPAVAVQLKYSNLDNINKIEDLVVDDITYDVTFHYGSFFNLFGSPDSSSFKTPAFWDNPQGAKNLVNSIALLLNSQQIVPTQINNYPSALVPYRGVFTPNDSLFVISKVDNYITKWDNYKGESQDIFTLGHEQANYAILSIKKPFNAIPEANMLPSVIVAFLIFGGIVANRK